LGIDAGPLALFFLPQPAPKPASAGANRPIRPSEDRPEAYLRVSRTDPGRRHSRCKLQTEPRHHRRRSGIDVAVNIFELGNCTQFGTDFGPVGIDGVRSCFSEIAMARRPRGPRNPAMPDASEEEWLRRRLWDNVLGLFAHTPAKNDLR
jgi:hypothetical protein